MHKTKLIRWIVTLVFILFLNSGTLKWMGFWPVDTTVLFGLLCIIIVIIEIFTAHYLQLGMPFVVKIFIVVIFWIFISCFYTPSHSYYLEKLNRTLLLLICLLFPIFVFKEKRWIATFREVFSIFGIVTIIILTVVYFMGDFSLKNYFIAASRPDSNIPDYLIVGQLLGVLFFLNLSRNTPVWIIVKICAFLMIIMLSGRGPVLSLGLLFVLNYILKSKVTLKNIIKWAALVIIMPFLLSFFFEWSGSQLMTSRIESLTQGDQSLMKRESLFKKSINLIKTHPVLGIGYGGFGITVEKKDGRAYPHNILLEMFVETGIIGFGLFIFYFIYFFRHYFWKLYFSNISNIATDFCLAFVFIFMQSLKSSSIVDVRLLFGICGIIIVVGMNRKWKIAY